MLQTSRTDGLLRCPRRGCNELLSGVRALTFHLHIHAVGAGSYACVRCGGAFESARELTRHACARRRARGAFFFLSFFPRFYSVFRTRLTIELPYDLFFSCPSLVLLFQTRRAPTQRRPCMDLPLFDRPGLWNASTMATSAPTSLKTLQTEGR